MKIYVTPFEYIKPGSQGTRETAQALYLQGFKLDEAQPLEILHWNFDDSPKDPSYSRRTCIRAIEPSAFISLKDLQRFEGVNRESSVYAVEEGMLYTKENSWLVCCPQQRFISNPPDADNVCLSILLDYSLYGVQFGNNGDKFLNKIFKDALSIGDAAFSRSDIKHFTIGRNLGGLGICAFADCDRLESVDIEDTQNTIVQFSMRKISDGTFMNCKNLKSVVIPEGVLCIEENAFSGCSKLEDVYIPSTLQCICRNAFAGGTHTINLHLSGGKKKESMRLGMRECEYLAGEPDFSGVENIKVASFYRNSYSLTKNLDSSSIGNIKFIEEA